MYTQSTKGNKMKISDTMVMESAAGFYLGQAYLEEDMPGDPNNGGMPYCRESDYFGTRKEAQRYLDYLNNQD